MKPILNALTCAMLLFAAIGTAPARAEVSVSLVIEGDIAEIQAILEHLRQAGFGGKATFNPFKMRVHSSAEAEKAASGPAAAGTPASAMAEEATPPPPPPPPVLAFEGLTVRPGRVPPGSTVMVSVKVVDEKNQVDTVAAMLTNGTRKFAFDLYDNGTHGDETAGDGRWSVNVTIPASADPDTYALKLSAYTTMGDPIMQPGSAGEPLSARAEVVVTADAVGVEPTE